MLRYAFDQGNDASIRMIRLLWKMIVPHQRRTLWEETASNYRFGRVRMIRVGARVLNVSMKLGTQSDLQRFLEDLPYPLSIWKWLHIRFTTVIYSYTPPIMRRYTLHSLFWTITLPQTNWMYSVRALLERDSQSEIWVFVKDFYPGFSELAYRNMYMYMYTL